MIIYIDEIDVSANIINFKITKEVGIKPFLIKIKASRKLMTTLTNASSELVPEKSIRINDGTDNIFQGYLKKINKREYIEIEGYDKLHQLSEVLVTKLYDKNIDASAGKISAIFQDLVTTYGGLNADATTIQDSGTTYILDKFVCNKATVFERCKKLAEVIGWTFYYNPKDDKVYFEPKGYTDSGVTLTYGTEIVKPIVWKYDSSDLFNKLELIGAQATTGTTENFTGDGTTTDYTLQKTPENVKVYVDGTLQTGGVEGSSSSYDYSIDRDNKKISFKVAPASSASVQIDYDYAIPTPVLLDNTESIASYGEKQKVITRLDIKNVTDAENYAQQLLSDYSEPFKSAEISFKSKNLNINAGNLVTIVDSINSINEQFLALKYEYTYPSNINKLRVGQRELRTEDWAEKTEDRIKRLEEEMTKNQDLLLMVKQFTKSFKLKKTELTIQTRTGTSLTVYDNPDTKYGDNNGYDSGSFSSWTTVYDTTY